IIFFFSDHGVGLPRAKRWLYDSGTRIPLIVRVPAQFRTDSQALAGSVCNELVSSLDLGMTVLNLAGVPVPGYAQGRAFLGNDLSPERRYVHGARDRMDERYDIIRAVRDHRYRYIRNFEPLKPYYQYMNTPESGALMNQIRIAERSHTLPPAAQLFSTGFKPLEELYDLENDPHEIHNLAADPAQAERLARMRDECLRWQIEIRDLGLVPEAEIEVREQGSESTFDILRSATEASTVVQLVNLAAKASEGLSALSDLKQALQHSDAAVRYWGATGLGNIGEPAAAAAGDLQALLGDPAPSVRIAAARGLCRMGFADQGLPALQEELVSDVQWGRLAAAIALDELDEAARPALASLKDALENQPNKYIVRVANKAVNDLLGTAHEVP
ncbi:MAG: HEAT repeat domain-containing protein, partial [Planctomycetales bacterium]|nr:HEAT repeat domain-containing protein [Planctomycetales bacterium]